MVARFVSLGHAAKVMKYTDWYILQLHKFRLQWLLAVALVEVPAITQKKAGSNYGSMPA
jgi:hypothetical protein